MTKCKQTLLWISIFCLCHQLQCDEQTTTTDKSDLNAAETQAGKLEIIKTIKKVNDDGSYTIGYEADDGSFKIESRDVLGNIKGTYGYVDDDGEIKRVSYSSTNASEIVTEPPTVVQRIPKISNKTYVVPRRPGVLLYNPTTPSTPTSTSVIQAIPRRRQTKTTTTSTENNTLKSTTSKPTVVYATSALKNYHYHPKLHVKATTPAVEVVKAEGQLLRPEVSTVKPTELPIFRRLALKSSHLVSEVSTIKPVSEDPEENSNVLRRQLQPDKVSQFETRQHFVNLHYGEDGTDVYGGTVPSGTPRPLFTTTARTRVLSTPVPEKSTPNFHVSTKRTTKPDYIQESTTETATAATVPVVQIPPNHEASQLVAIKHPFHRGLVLVPLSHLQTKNQEVDVQAHYFIPHEQYLKDISSTTPSPNVESQQNAVPVYVQRAYPHMVRPMPVQVDESGYIRPIVQEVRPTPLPFQPSYSVPIPVATPAPPPRFLESTIQNEIDRITPPVSTRDFQRLLEQLTVRQSRLEKVNALLQAQRHRELQQARYHIIQASAVPAVVQRAQEVPAAVSFIPEQQIQRSRPVSASHLQPHQVFVGKHSNMQGYYFQEPEYASTAYTPTKRVARLLPPDSQNEESENEEYLPPQIREMLLLRMLQLAINPTLPLSVTPNEYPQEVTAPSQIEAVKTGVRNVEVLGEETSEEDKKTNRIKRFQESAEEMMKQEQ